MLFPLLAPAAPATSDLAGKTFVWAHYTPWATPLDSSLTVTRYYNYPLFRSTGESRADRIEEFHQAKAQGIDGFLVDVVFDRKGGFTHYSDSVHEMLKAAAGSDFLVAPCLDIKTTVDQQVSELDRMLTLFGNHPNYPRYNGRPIVATYTWSQWTPDEWSAIRSQLKERGHDVYLIANVGRSYQKQTCEWLHSQLANADAVYAFGFRGLDGMPRSHPAGLIASVADEMGLLNMPGLVHGYYGAWLNGRNDFYQPHQGFDQLHKSFELVRLGKDRWLHFSTWNDHDETSLLPMLFSTANPLLTKAYSDAFKGIAPTSILPDVCLAYHREVIPGTLLRIEAINLPSLAPGAISIKGRLLDRDGKSVAILASKNLHPAKFDRIEWLLPTSGLATSPFLVPEITITCHGFSHTTKLPPVLLVNGWQQNAVTIKVPVRQHIDIANTLFVRSNSPESVEASIWFDAPVDVTDITLFRNDRPIAPFGPDTDGKMVMNIYIKGPSDYEISVDDTGGFLDAVRKFSERNSPAFRLTPTTITNRQAQDWAPSGANCAVKSTTKFTLKTPGKEPLEMTAVELARKGFLQYGKLQIEVIPVDPAIQNHAALKSKNGRFTLSLLLPEQRVSDMFYVQYQTADGHIGLSNIVYPFAPKGKLLTANVVETSVNLETSSNASGLKGESEFLTADIPFRTPSVVTVQIPHESIRSGYWSFDGHGRDNLGDMPVIIAPEMFAPRSLDGGSGTEQVLVLDGKNPVKMRLRTWPIGNATIDFDLNPDAGVATIQSVIGRRGWSDGISINLLPDGRIEVVRDGSETVPIEKLTSQTKLPFGQWSHLRVTNDSAYLRIYIDNRLDAEKSICPARSYGNSTWFVGGGYKNHANYRGKIDNLFVSGAVTEL